MALRVSTSKRAAFTGAVFAGLAAFGMIAPAQAQDRAGMLTCNVAAGPGLLVTSSRALDCVFTPTLGGPAERYLGTVNRYGLDLGVTGPGGLAWGVIAPSAVLGPGALQGMYVGVGAGATVGVGVNANLLVGGNGQTTSLQPLSLQGQTGLNVAAGVSQITLEYASPAPARRTRTARRHRVRYYR